MSSPELNAAWCRTEGYLRDARSHLSEATEAIHADDIRDVERFLEHKEFGLAFDLLDEITRENELETLRVRELLALAAASMGLIAKQQAIDSELTKARGAGCRPTI